MILLGLFTKIKYSITKHKMYPDGGIKLARTGMRNKLFSLHGLIRNYFAILEGVLITDIHYIIHNSYLSTQLINYSDSYEGTGRSLSLKLIDQLKKQSVQLPVAAADVDAPVLTSSRMLQEVTLEEPIRYGVGDLVEKWLHDLLCLDVNKVTPNIPYTYLITLSSNKVMIFSTYYI